MDLLLNEKHDLQLVNYDLFLVKGQDLMKQRLVQSLKFFLGEWYLDETAGVPYFQEILKKAPDRVIVESAFKAAIMKTPGVIELTVFNITYDNPIRNVYISFKVKTVYGQVSIEETL